MNKISRREMLRLMLIGGGGTLLSSYTYFPVQWSAASTLPGAAPTATAPTSNFVPDVEIDLKASQRQVPILSGQPTTVWTYQGTLVRGETSNLLALKDSYLGPIIRVRKGQKVRIRFSHDLPDPSIIHWHGLLLPSRMDGNPRDAIQRDQTYVYEFEVVNRAGTYWFHPHPEPITGSQVVSGLAGLFLVSDDEEEVAGLPSGAYDVPLVIQDRTFDQDNQIVYVQGDTMPGMASMDMIMGFLGDRILVNGQVTPMLPVATRAYRLRLLNGSNSRIYKLAWSDGTPLTVIATDGGLLEKPVERPYVMLGPGERVELWADFSQYQAGTEITLQSLAFVGAEGDSLLETAPAPMTETMSDTEGMEGTEMPGMEHNMPGMGETTPPTSMIEEMPGMEHSMPGMGETATSANGNGGGEGMAGYNPTLPNGAAFPILHIGVVRQEEETLSLPAKLSTINRYQLEQAVNGQQPRRFGLSMRNSTWLINGRPFELEAVAPDEIVRLNSLEAWEFVNELNPNETMEKLGMAHPLHIHGVQFQVIDRQTLVPELKTVWDSVGEGFVEDGWKDTVLVMPGQSVTVLLKFDFPDLFLYHCHNLEHEDLGMMRNYRVDS